MLFEASDEGGVAGLGLLPGRIRRFPAECMRGSDGTALKVPHMGWNEVVRLQNHVLWDGIAQGSRFYFVHSYFAAADAGDLVAARCTYGVPFAAAVARENIFAVQFHPEKSQAAGLRLLTNFVAWQPALRPAHRIPAAA